MQLMWQWGILVVNASAEMEVTSLPYCILQAFIAMSRYHLTDRVSVWNSLEHCIWVAAGWETSQEFTASQQCQREGKMAFKQRKRMNVQCFGMELYSGFWVLFSELSQARYVKADVVSNLLSQFSCQSKDNNVGGNCRIWQMVPVKSSVLQKEALSCSHTPAKIQHEKYCIEWE